MLLLKCVQACKLMQRGVLLGAVTQHRALVGSVVRGSCVGRQRRALVVRWEAASCDGSLGLMA